MMKLVKECQSVPPLVILAWALLFSICPFVSKQPGDSAMSHLMKMTQNRKHLQEVSATPRLNSYGRKARMNRKRRKFMSQHWHQRYTDLHGGRERDTLRKDLMDSEWARKWEIASKKTIFYYLQGNMIVCTLLSGRQKCNEKKNGKVLLVSCCMLCNFPAQCVSLSKRAQLKHPKP